MGDFFEYFMLMEQDFFSFVCIFILDGAFIIGLIIIYMFEELGF